MATTASSFLLLYLLHGLNLHGLLWLPLPSLNMLVRRLRSPFLLSFGSLYPFHAEALGAGGQQVKTVVRIVRLF
ncbi:hypothetical protein B0J12DRAFT_292640 [Macrophomina phaseolina]|uniref:Secreted protein n=1 Tax=Macrophomina phaseolina TaxID=35725 RepID=A0ABQ8GPA4_9PEZI|nr:hypothetical protein B0J12DRAFT_292640 [Macrophomina phaseolina]